jgi:large subunit ribosomal protein L4
VAERGNIRFMALIDVHNIKGDKVSERELKDEIFAVSVRDDLLHQVVRAQLASSRSGSASTKKRSEVTASGRKLWRQKGTGRARVGEASSPLRRGGGVAFGPMPRDYSFKVNKKVRKAALRMALADKLKEGQLIVVDDFHLEQIKTKAFCEILRNLEVDNVLIVTVEHDENLGRSTRNIRTVKLLRAEGLNVYDVLRHEYLLFVEPALGKVEEVLA